MGDINRVVVGGRLTRDPELRATAGGTSVLTFSLASNERRQNRQTGEWENCPSYVDCAVFGKRADALSRILSKGTHAVVEGRLRWSQWEKDGQRRSKIEVVVDEVELPSAGGGREATARPEQAGGEDIPF